MKCILFVFSCPLQPYGASFGFGTCSTAVLPNHPNRMRCQANMLCRWGEVFYGSILWCISFDVVKTKPLLDMPLVVGWVLSTHSATA